MPTIEVTEAEYDRLDTLCETLADECVDGYGTVRHTDAIEYLLDCHADDPSAAADGASVAGGAAGTDTDGDGEDTDGDTEADTGEGGENTDEDGDGRLSAMMSLLEDHDEKWRETDAEDGTYEVDLPDGGVELVRTKHDIRAVLFEHY